MPIASKIVNGAASLIGAKPSGQSISDNEMADGIETMNDMFSELASSGVHLGYQVCTESTDETYIPDWAVGMAKSNLATRLAPEYDRPISKSLGVFATRSMDAVLLRVNTGIEVNFPDTLPIGEDQTWYEEDKYFTDPTINDLETGLSVSLKDDGNDDIEVDS